MDEFHGGAHSCSIDEVIFRYLPAFGTWRTGRQDWDIMGLEVRHQIIGDIAGCSLKMIDHAFFDEINCFVK